MIRTLLLIFALTLPGQAAFADANSIRESIVRELRSDGFSSIRVSRTLLGRNRFVAEDGTRRREIVVNPRTGLILRDYVRYLSRDDGELEVTSGSQAGQEDDDHGTSGGNSGSSDDDDDDSDDDDDDDRSESGSNDDDDDDDDDD